MVTTHHGPGRHLPGVLGELREGGYRDLCHLHGAYAVSFRPARPTRLQISIADATGGTEVEVRVDAYVRPRVRRV